MAVTYLIACILNRFSLKFNQNQVFSNLNLCKLRYIHTQINLPHKTLQVAFRVTQFRLQNGSCCCSYNCSRYISDPFYLTTGFLSCYPFSSYLQQSIIYANSFILSFIPSLCCSPSKSTHSPEVLTHTS